MHEELNCPCEGLKEKALEQITSSLARMSQAREKYIENFVPAGKENEVKES